MNEEKKTERPVYRVDVTYTNGYGAIVPAVSARIMEGGVMSLLHPDGNVTWYSPARWATAEIKEEI